MKKLLALAVIVSVLVTIQVSALQKTADVFINNTRIDGAAVVNNEIYVPLSDVAWAMGASVSTVSGSTYLQAADKDELIPEVIKSVSPSVVAIIGKYKPGNIPASLEKYNDWTAHGTGIVIRQDGYILTNAHVVEEMENLTVVLHDGVTAAAKLKYIDTISDLAVITIEKTGLTPIKFGSMDSVVAGKTVVAIGTPISFSLRNSATSGIISGINRSLNGEYRLIQTDAAINQGNSGGPLVNLNGELIGVNSLKYVGYGIEGMCFSIPVDTVEYVLDNFYGYGKVMRPIIGLNLEESWEALHGLPTNSGVTVKSVADKSPGANAGVLRGDVILKVNGSAVNSIVDYNELLKKVNMGEKIVLTVRRGAGTLDLSISPNF